MKTVSLNLADRQSWQKFRHLLTSFVSDYIDLVAPEQPEAKLEQETLSLAFTLIAVSPDRQRANRFTQDLEAFLHRLRLAGVRQVNLEFFAADEELPILQSSFALPFIETVAAQPTSAIARRQDRSALSTKDNAKASRGRGNALVRRVKNWLASPELAEKVDTTSKLAVRDPKSLLAGAKSTAVAKFTQTIDWVDTFPWEDWFAGKVQWQKRRHKRNLFKALFEDVIVLGIIAMALLWVTNFLSGPTMNLALLPPQHYDSNFAHQYRCGSAGLSKKNYVCLNRGMSYRQVSSILGDEGRPLGIDHKFGEQAVVISWQSGKEALNATFRDDRLIAKAQRNLS